MSITLRIKHVNHVPELTEKLGTLATVEVIQGSSSALAMGEFMDPTTGDRWQLTSIAFCDPPNAVTLPVAFKRVSGRAELTVGMELREIGGAAG